MTLTIEQEYFRRDGSSDLSHLPLVLVNEEGKCDPEVASEYFHFGKGGVEP